MRKLLAVGVLGLMGTTGCGAISDWRLERQVRSECEEAAHLGHPVRQLTYDQAFEECYVTNLEQIRG